MSDHRSVSTVFDVAIALVLISASVTLMFVFLDSGEPEPAPVEADRTAETLASTTTSVQYSLAPVVEHDQEMGTELFDGTTGHSMQRSAHGPIVGLIGQVAVSNASFWGMEYTRTSTEFEAALDGAVRQETTIMDHSARVDAIWRPYDGAGIEGTAGGGQAVPSDTDVSSVTLTVGSGLPDISEEINETYDGDGEFDTAATLISETVIEEFLPPAEMQRALESSGLDRELALYRYARMSMILDSVHDPAWANETIYDPGWEQATYPFHPDNGTMDRGTVNALWLNQYMIEQTLANKIESDLEAQFDENTTAAELASAVSTDQVQLTVRTWGTDE